MIAQPTQQQINQMIFARTFRTGNDIVEAREWLKAFLDHSDGIEELAENLRFYGFITNSEALNLARGNGWTVPEMSDELFTRYSTPGRFSKASA